MVPDRHFALVEDDPRRYEALLQIADLMVRPGGLADLFRELVGLLRKVAAFDFAGFSLYDSARDKMRIFLWDGSQLDPAPLELSVDESLLGWAWRDQQPVVVQDYLSEKKSPPLSDLLTRRGVRSSCALPLTTARRRLGGLGLGSTNPGAYGEHDVRLLRGVSELVALAVESALTRAALEGEKRRQKMLLDLNATLISSRDPRRLFPAIAELIRSVIRQDYASLAVYDEARHCLRLQVMDYPPTQEHIVPVCDIPLEGSACGQAFSEGEAKIFTPAQLGEINAGGIYRLFQRGFKSACCIPLITQKGPIGTLNLCNRKADAFVPEDLSFLRQLADQIATALDNAFAYQEVQGLTQKLKKERLYLQEEIRSVMDFEEIIGDSPALKRVLNQVSTVAPLDATVLILGETGTGKELIARGIHRMSARKGASFIKLNCAAIPTGLLESELFGHEKGAFTGAITQKVGRLELADQGTLFLDEVGEIPLELQPKLLRVLQDQEFERLGGVRTIRVNLRLIAATNRDLAKSVAAREFRDDLYYRLRVFPVEMPPLRERSRDIPLLVSYFVQRFARRMNKHIETIPTETMNALSQWSWPGNVRELENFIERAVILSVGTALNAPLAELKVQVGAALQSTTLESLQREHILRVLRETGGVIAGLHGAAARLGMKRTTLQSRMQKMGITREEYQN